MGIFGDRKSRDSEGERLAEFMRREERQRSIAELEEVHRQQKRVLGAMNGEFGTDMDEALKTESASHSMDVQEGKPLQAAWSALWTARAHELKGETGEALAWYTAAARFYDEGEQPECAVAIRTELGQRELPPKPMPGGWVCSSCGSGNPRSAKRCLVCNRHNSVERPLPRVVVDTRSAPEHVSVPPSLVGSWVEVKEGRLVLGFGADGVLSFYGRPQGVLRESEADSFVIEMDHGTMECTYRIESDNLFVTGIAGGPGGANPEVQFRRQ